VAVALDTRRLVSSEFPQCRSPGAGLNGQMPAPKLLSLGDFVTLMFLMASAKCRTPHDRYQRTGGRYDNQWHRVEVPELNNTRAETGVWLLNTSFSRHWGAFGHLAALRMRLAAWTMLMRAGRTSSHLRVLRPQSGLTHI
jgi:hypothetical protein